MNKFKKDGRKRAAFLVFILVLILPMFGYAQQLPNQPNIPRPLLQKLRGPQWSQNKLLAQKAQASQKQAPAVKKDKYKKHYDELLKKAQQNGYVDIIVILVIPNLPDDTRVPHASKEEKIRIMQARKEAIANSQDRLLKRMAKYKLNVGRKLEYTPGMSMKVDAAALEALIADPEVDHIGENKKMFPSLPQSGPLIGADQAWAKGFTGAGYTIAIVDTGVSRSHPFLAGKVVAEACFSENLCPNGQPSQIGPGAAINCNLDHCDHGTHVTGIAAGTGTSFSGVAKDANIIAVQVFSQYEGDDCNPVPSPCDGSVRPSSSPCISSRTIDQEAALDWVHQQRVHYQIAAVNMSLGGGQYTETCDNDTDSIAMKSQIDALRNDGIATVIASGNEGCTNAIASPACISSAISVGATTKTDTVPSYSNSASFLSLLAPGGDGAGGLSAQCAEGDGKICSSIPLVVNPPDTFAYKYMRGTSMAAPHVAGAFAVLKQQSPTASVDDILSILQSAGVDVLDTRNNITKPRINLVNTPWAARYSGPGRMNEPTAISTSATGNVYVTGFSCTDEMCSRRDYATIKYSPIGAQLWARRYSGGVDSAALALAVDGQGSVYVAGYVCQYIDPSTYNCGHADYVTIKYDTNGNQLWTATYNEGDLSWPTAINVDTSGHAYVTGYSCAGTNCFTGDNITAYATVKYDTNGNQLWAKRYSYTQGYDWATALALDSSGNVYVIGSSCSLIDSMRMYCYAYDEATIKYDTYGNQLWVSRYPDMSGEGIAVDSLGNAYITGGVWSSDSGYVTVKYDSSSGNQLWVVPYGMSGGARDIAVDGSGNVYVTGDTSDPTFSFDEYATVKYDTNGNQLWVAIYSDFGSAHATHVAVDTAENVYVTGNEGMGNYVTLKYDSNGNKVWMARQFGSHGGYNPALSVHGGNVYITGSACVDSICDHHDYLTLKYTP